MQSVSEAIQANGWMSGAMSGSEAARVDPDANLGKCERCKKNQFKGYFVIPEHELADGYIVTTSIWICPNKDTCTKRGELKKQETEQRIKRSGLPDDLKAKTVNDFTVTEPYQQALKQTAANYAHKWDTGYCREWMLLSGQTGCGKTHLAAAVSMKIMRDGRQVKFVRWLDLMRDVKRFDYQQLVYAQETGILFLDDLYKFSPTPDELKATYELIDYRYLSGLPTIITTERTASELQEIDMAVFGRIAERTGKNWAAVANDPRRNMRIRMMEDKV